MTPRRAVLLMVCLFGVLGYASAQPSQPAQTIVQPLRIFNPTGYPIVETYVWNNERLETYLLDENSQRGRVYEVTWLLRADGVDLQGDYIRQLTELRTLTDTTFLSVAVAFHDPGENDQRTIFEYRYPFRINRADDTIEMLPPEGWHTPNYETVEFYRTNIDAVLGGMPLFAPPPTPTPTPSPVPSLTPTHTPTPPPPTRDFTTPTSVPLLE